MRSLEHLKTLLPAGIFHEPQAAPLEKIAAVHDEKVVQLVEKEGYFDPDTPGAAGIWNCSLLSAGAALQAASDGLKGKKAFSLMRPPGHHATPRQGNGLFCYFNSMAVAIQDVTRREISGKVAVLDLDCHHGNGTEDFCLGTEEFLYLSLHQFPAYPGTGRQSRANCVNYPLAPGTRGGLFSGNGKRDEKIRDFKPDLLGLSMGFDTYEKDPLTQFGLVKKDYRKMGKWLKDFGFPTFTLLEGGYHDDLPYLIEDFLMGWTT